MFYYFSKIVWAIVNPVTLYGLLVATTCLASFLPRQRLARVLAGVTLVVTAFSMTVPLGAYLNRVIEDRFPQPTAMPNSVDGIVVLGGPVDPEMTRNRGIYAVNGAFDRVIAFAELAERYPTAKLVYTGGSHTWTPGIGEAEVMAPLLERMGINPGRVAFEAKSRNTVQNAQLSKQLVDPKPGETWILVTSGYHMPRAIGTFRHAGWPENLIAYPVDFRYRTNADISMFSWDVVGRLGQLSGAVHELLGLTVYYLTDRSDDWFPAPN